MTTFPPSPQPSPSGLVFTHIFLAGHRRVAETSGKSRPKGARPQQAPTFASPRRTKGAAKDLGFRRFSARPTVSSKRDVGHVQLRERVGVRAARKCERGANLTRS